MKTKIKRIAYAAASAALMAPAIVAAQWDAGTSNAGQANLPAGSVTNIILNVMKWLLGLAGIIGVIGFVVAGILYLTAAGDEDKIATAKKAMTFSIIGVIVAILGFVVIQAATAMLGGSSTTY